MLTYWFSVRSGVVQGNNLAPTIFAIFINDIADEINNLGYGVQLSDGERLSLLMYADDLVLIASSPQELQYMLNALHKWTNKWRLAINIEKTKVMHCRKQRVKKTDFKFIMTLRLSAHTVTSD